MKWRNIYRKHTSPYPHDDQNQDVTLKVRNPASDGERFLISRHVALAAIVILAIAILTPVIMLNLSNQTPRLQMLRLVDGQVVNDEGKRVYLDGVNYKDRFKDLLYTGNWSGISSDIGTMSSLHVRAIRVWFNWLYYEPTPGSLDSVRMLSDMQRFIGLAKAHGLYVMLTIFTQEFERNDTQIRNWIKALGDSAPNADPNIPEFWLNDNVNASLQRGRFINLWQIISGEFKNEPAVAAYDLINEPLVRYYPQLPTWTQTVGVKDPHYPLMALYEQVIEAIRSNGDEHLIMLDYNFANSEDLFIPVAPSSDNQVLYDIHMYRTASAQVEQGWDHTYPNYGPWNGNDQQGNQINYTYPDNGTGHFKEALRSRFQALLQSRAYTFVVGEFGDTTNNAYDTDVASLIVEFGICGFSYFEYNPLHAEGSLSVVGPVMTFART